MPNRSLEVAANATLRFRYDWDDQNLQFLLLVNDSGAVKILPIDEALWRARGYDQCCWRPAEDSYVVPPLETLADAPVALRPTLDGHYVMYQP
jgi:hypothetical protein